MVILNKNEVGILNFQDNSCGSWREGSCHWVVQTSKTE